MTHQNPIAWRPQPKQKILIDCPYREIFFGGSRGGGKSNGILGKYGIKSMRYKHTNAIFFRKELPQADDLIEEAKEIYLRLKGVEYKMQSKTFEFPTGSRVRFRPLANEQDAEKYQGQNLTDCAVEEAGNYENPKPIDKLFGALRSKHGVPTQLIMTANPGGVGQLWIKERFIDPAPLGMKTLTRELPNGQKHKYIYIPSRVQDNQILLQNDPNYINNLYLVGSKELVKAWLEGSWDAIEGAYFPEFSVDRHVIKPFKIPERWKRYIGYDWGYFSDSACVWIAISDGRDDNGEKVKYPKGSVIVYREWIESKLSNEDQAKKILELSQGEEIEIRAADPSIFASQGGPSIAQQMQDCGLTFHKADNARVAGWSQLRRRLNPGEGLTPMIYFFDACTTAIEAVAVAPVCKKNAEDLDTTFPNDHVLDSLRYSLMENLYVQTDYHKPEEYATKGLVSVSKLIQAHKAKNRKSKI